jgi:hypothetical protein
MAKVLGRLKKPNPNNPMNTKIKQKSRLRLIAIAAGSLVLSGSLAMAQAVRQDTPEASAPNAAPIPVTTQPVTPPPIDDDIIMMSPFQVDSTREKGYFAENTLAGSRMRTNIADLGAAITVVTKQQLEDTASLDVNDIFRYEIGTEGSSTYTPEGLTSRGSGLSDSIAGINNGGNTTASTNSTANRVRGLGAPSFSLNYYSTISQIPFDSYNAASFEINRGPNSMLFGMGSPAGIVNQSTAQAQINKNNASVQVRIDDRGSSRASLSFNKTLVKDKLAIYGALLYNDQQFERKPSYDITRRQYGAITYKPFKKTKITASIEGYDNDNRRPNSLTPVDGVTEWLKAGRPVYNSKTHEITLLDTGKVVSMVVGSQYSYMADSLRTFIAGLPGYDETKWNADRTQYDNIGIFGTGPITNVNSILFVQGLNFQSAGRTMMKVADGTLQRWFQPVQGNNPRLRYDVAPSASTGYNVATTVSELSTTAGDPNYIWTNNTWVDVYDRYETRSDLISMTLNPPDPNYLTKRYPAVNDKSIYDWEHVNILNMHVGWQRNTNYNIEFEQEILPGLLNFSAGWFRQDFDSMQLYNVGSLDGTTLYVDTNMYDSEGNDNPLYGRPYVRGTDDPDRMEDAQTVDQYRALLAFTPDFTKNKNWTRWLGRHQILGLASYMDYERTTIRKRLQFADGDPMVKTRYMASPQVQGWKLEGNQSYALFYLSDGGYSVNQSPGPFYPSDSNAPITGQLTVYDYTASQFRNLDATMIWHPHSAGTGKSARTLTSYSMGWTGYLWEDRIIATAGIRRDINSTRATNSAGTRPAGLSAKEAVEWDMTYWVNGVYQLDKVFKLWNDWAKVSGTTNTVGAVVKPFLHWEPIARRAGDNLFWEFVENFGFSYNKSDNFDAPSTSYVDFQGNALGKPSGEGTDYGIQFSLFKNKLFARLNWFESTNENSPAASGSSNAIQRLWWHVDSTAFRGWLEHIWLLNQGADPSLQDWKKQWTDDTDARLRMEQWVGENWGLNNDYDYYNHLGGTLGSTKSTKAKGVELSVSYNPLPNWTLKLTASKIETKNDNVLKEVDTWIAMRDPVWKNAKAEDYLNATGRATLERLGGIGSYTLYNTERKGDIREFWQSTNFDTFTQGTPISSTAIDGSTTMEGYWNALYYPHYALERDLQDQQVMGQRKYNGSVVTNYTFDRGMLKGWAVGGAQRYSSKAIIGYKGKASGANGTLLDISDISQPIYDKAEWYTDLWVSYTRKIFNDKVRMKLQLNVADIFEDGGLKPVRVAFDGMPYAYRIIDSRQFILTATFDF